jgi:ribosome-binding factor A
MANPRTIARLEARIQERAAHCLQFELKDPRSTFVTITRVELAPDLTRGKIYFSCLGSEADRHKTEKMIADAAGFIQRQVARVLETRTVPHLAWEYDESIARAAELDRLINEARSRDEAIRPGGLDQADEGADDSVPSQE